MRKVMIGTLFVLVAALVPLSVRAQIGVSVNVNVPLPPPIVFPAPPELVVIPETYVYAVPDVEADIFFSQGWWWRPWQGRWYRSRRYDNGWAYYRATPPAFYRRVPPGWRNDYREHRWKGREWKHERIPHGHMERNWRGWEKDKHWQRQNTWGVQGVGPRSVGPMGGPRGYQAPQGQPRQDRQHGQHGRDGRAFQPGPQRPHPGGPPGGPNRGHDRGHGQDHRGGHGRR